MCVPKFLIIRFSSIGDIVLTTPVVRWLKKQIPGAEVHYLTKKPFTDILQGNPYLDKIFSIEKSSREILPLLVEENYDYLIDLHNNFRSLTVKTLVKAPSLSVKKYHFQRLKMVFLKDRKPFAGHVVERYLSCISSLKIIDDKIGLDFFIENESSLNTENLCGVKENTYIALVIGAKHFTKRMPPEKLKELLSVLPAKTVLLGGKEDKEMAEQLAGSFPKNVINACGRLSLKESAFMVKHAMAVITHDTGLMHIAAAFNKKIISVWGGTVPELGMTPWMPQNPELSYIVENRHLKCRPCSKIGRNSCPEKHFKCMKDIAVKDIVAPLVQA